MLAANKFWERRRQRLFIRLLAMACMGAASVEGQPVDIAKLPAAATQPVDFTRDIQPIFQAYCVKCHGPDKQKGGFRLDDKEAALKGGENHPPAIKPNNSADSPLIHFVSDAVPDMKMPPKDGALSGEQIGLLRAWIDQGAAWPESGAKKEIHWAFKSVERPPIPASTKRKSKTTNPIDAFTVARLAESKLPPSREADRRTLVRRLYFDLIGLPPTPEEVTAFERDKSLD